MKLIYEIICDARTKSNNQVVPFGIEMHRGSNERKPVGANRFRFTNRCPEW